MIKKPEFTKILSKWLKVYLEKVYGSEYDIKIVTPLSNLSKLAESEIKTIDGYSSFDFKPDILGLLTHKKTNKTDLVFLNRSISAISLKEIGEMVCYSRLAKPINSFIISLKGLPNEVNLLLLDRIKEKKILEFSSNKYIFLGKFDVKTNSIDEKSIFPIHKRKGKTK